MKWVLITVHMHGVCCIVLWKTAMAIYICIRYSCTETIFCYIYTLCSKRYYNKDIFKEKRNLFYFLKKKMTLRVSNNYIWLAWIWGKRSSVCWLDGLSRIYLFSETYISHKNTAVTVRMCHELFLFVHINMYCFKYLELLVIYMPDSILKLTATKLVFNDASKIRPRAIGTWSSTKIV